MDISFRIFSVSLIRSFSNIFTVPEVGNNCVAQILTKVVFPAPFLPRRVNILPGSIFSEILLIAKVDDPLYFLVTSTASIAFIIHNTTFQY